MNVLIMDMSSYLFSKSAILHILLIRIYLVCSCTSVIEIFALTWPALQRECSPNHPTHIPIIPV